MKRCENYRYVEKRSPYRDLTFKFYSDGKLTILDNDAGTSIAPKELRGDSFDFYVKRRIEFIKNDLAAKRLKYA
ncbi:hypothetical protein [Paenibacillus sp. MMS18-CY102]|uniref:hypothetical protein n=1 Tax=Paenibacillus sp. MMS18-CY102 TaxID=2682849 RepID=UPI00136544E0|nr:hypothetical protein [Paenibacillus sp. MMS18-CY102]MWC28218.1 hypothetical protein [Paenibacillus sp. MMS18-CY102]